MKNLLIRIAIIIPVLVASFFVFKLNPNTKDSSRNPEVLGSSIIITVGDSGISCETKALTIHPITSQSTEIDGINLKGAPLGAVVTYQTSCQNTGTTNLTNVVLTNNLNAPGQNYLEFDATSESDCSYAGGKLTCNLGQLTVGGNFTRSFKVKLAEEVQATTEVVNNTAITTDEDITVNTTNSFNVFRRPTCDGLTADSITIAPNGTANFTASGTTFDGSPPTFTINFGDSTPEQTATTATFTHIFEGSSSEDQYYVTLRITDSVGNSTGDPLNCSANCSKVITVWAPSQQKYCSCQSGGPVCTAGFGGQTCSDASSCTCVFYCDQNQLTVSPTSGKSPLAVTVNAAAGGQPKTPLTFKFYNSGQLIKQSTSQTNSISETLTLTNSTSTIQIHQIMVGITDNSGVTASNQCFATEAVQPADSIPPIPPQPPAGNFTCRLTATPGSGVAPLTTNLTTSVSGGANPYQYLFSFGDGTGNVSLTTNVTSHQYLTVGTYSPSTVVTDAAGQNASCRTNLAANNPQSTVSAVENFHLECDAITLVCEAVEGPGTNSCAANSDCKKISIPAHSVCNKTKKICKSYFGYGPSTCSSNGDCGKTETGSVFLTFVAFLGSVSLLSLGYVIIIRPGRK